MKTTKFFLMAALALASAACSNDDNEITQQPAKAEGIPFTATISVANDGATTRALSEDGTTLKATWAAGEKVALVHNSVCDEMTVESVSTDGVATITGTITGSPSDGAEVTVIYPASAVDETSKDVKADLLYAQAGGTLADVASKYDVRKGSGTLKVSAETASLNGNVSLDNQFAIFKFTTQDSDASATISVTALTITIGTQDYVVTPASATNELYAALPAVSSQTVSFSATGSDSKTYTCSKDGVNFDTGKYYQSTLKMKAASGITSPAVGQIIGSDGKNYAADATLPADVTKVAMIAYVNGSNGLAIQLNSIPVEKNWADAKTYAEGLNTSTPIAGGTWRLPSKEDWQNMFLGCAVSGDVSASDSMNPIAGFKEKIAATGITWKSDAYWSSTPSGSSAWYVYVSLGGSDAGADFYELDTSIPCSVLGCLAF